MIDLVDLSINVRHKPFGNVRKIEKEHSTKTDFFSKKIRLYDGGAQVIVTSMGEGKKIGIRCSPLKVLQGHNIFGDDNVKGFCYHLIHFVLQKLKIPATPKQHVAWKSGEYDLENLDITYHFAAASNDIARRNVLHVFRNIKVKQCPEFMKKGFGFEMQAPHPFARWSMYLKLIEFADKRNNEHNYLSALVRNRSKYTVVEKRLREAASNSIRLELKLDADYLEKNHLNRGSAWTSAKVKEIYLEELDLLRLGTIPSIDHAASLLDRLEKSNLRLTFIAWMCNELESTLQSRETRATHRQAIRETVGIDITLDRVPLKVSPVSIADVFSLVNMLPAFPDWIDKYPQVGYRGKGVPGLLKPD